MGLVDNFTRNDRPSFRDLHLHTFEGCGESLAELSAHHDSVGLVSARPLSAVDLHAMLPDNRFCDQVRASPVYVSHPGDFRKVRLKGLDQSPRAGSFERFIARGYPELAEDGSDVSLDGVHGDVEGLAYLPVRVVAVK